MLWGAVTGGLATPVRMRDGLRCHLGRRGHGVWVTAGAKTFSLGMHAFAYGA